MVKNFLLKAEDPYLVLHVLNYRATPLQCGFSPAEMSMGRHLRTRVPAVPASLAPDWPRLSYMKLANANQKEVQKFFCFCFWQTAQSYTTSYSVAWRASLDQGTCRGGGWSREACRTEVLRSQNAVRTTHKEQNTPEPTTFHTAISSEVQPCCSIDIARSRGGQLSDGSGPFPSEAPSDHNAVCLTAASYSKCGNVSPWADNQKRSCCESAPKTWSLMWAAWFDKEWPWTA